METILESKRLLVVDDDECLLQVLPDTIRYRFPTIEVDTAPSAAAALDLLKDASVDTVLTDVKMAGMDGLELTKKISDLYPGIPVLVMSGHMERDLGLRALEAGAYGYIGKPIDPAVLAQWLHRSLQWRTVLSEATLTQLKERFALQAGSLNGLDVAVIATDVAGRILFWNHHAEVLYGWRQDEVLGRDIVDVTPADVSRDEATAIMRLLQQGQQWAGRFPVRRRDGRTFVARVTDYPIRNARGELVGIVGVSSPVVLSDAAAS